MLSLENKIDKLPSWLLYALAALSILTCSGAFGAGGIFLSLISGIILLVSIATRRSSAGKYVYLAFLIAHTLIYCINFIVYLDTRKISPLAFVILGICVLLNVLFMYLVIAGHGDVKSVNTVFIILYALLLLCAVLSLTALLFSASNSKVNYHKSILPCILSLYSLSVALCSFALTSQHMKKRKKKIDEPYCSAPDPEDTSAGSVEDELKRLKAMYENGEITAEEYALRKKQLLSNI